ncbi:hypothetical protein Esi_0152_0062 [Ectocarpus siliculosus]|uniref:Diphthine--ammonia ligase n=1 Tax=Ectocarpus siliculosus TaxID=2880 RepID=D8LFY2_ECTSI|nr:hypothetical protein Esi_0152_0062 [Ectocarpus siliculosus]|eukprot:CBN78881.1 hypothetical protein Esi_0152_0062 [Ectocarpus siliculosus]
MKFVALISGGKDSCYNTLEASPDNDIHSVCEVEVWPAIGPG